MNEVFEQLTREYFQFLESQYGCQIMDVEKSNYGCLVWYKNESIAIRISYEIYDAGIFVTLYRLQKGQLPDFPVFFDPTAELLVFDINDLLLARNMERLPRGSAAIYNKDALEQTIKLYAHALTEHGRDVIEGNFSILPKIKDVVARRAKELEDEQ